jgi:4-hydroxyphenylacetate 3-monooxygenase
MCKNIAKTEFLLGTIDMMVNAYGLESYGHIIEKVTEVIVAIETLQAFQLAAEKGASVDRWGNMLPARKPLLAENVYFQQVYPRIIEIIQLIGASNLIMIPEEKDFAAAMRDQLYRYMKGIDLDAKKSVQLSRLAWELSVSTFGGRQTVYERFFFGNASVVNSRLYAEYQSTRHKYQDRVKDFLS